MEAEFLYLGVDGGGTKCRARLRSPDGALLGEGLGGPANIRLGMDIAWANIGAAIDAALAQARLDRRAYARIHLGLGLAGITTAEAAAATVASGPRFAEAVAASDAHAACLGAFSGRDGAILIAGTGSNGYAWINGQSYGVGGWGFEVNDDGSGASLGRAALRAALHGFDGLAPHTALTQAVIEHFGGHPSDIVDWVGTARPGDYGALAPMVLSFAASGDPVAVQLVQRAAQDLALYISRLHALGAPHVCLVGGLAEPMTPWLNPWARSLLRAPEHDAVEGALLMARGAFNRLVQEAAA